MGGEVKRVKALDSAGCFAGVSRMRENNCSPGCSPRVNDVWQTLSSFSVKEGCKCKESGLGVPSL